MFRTAILCSARAIAVRPATTGRTARLAHAAAASRTPSWSSSSAARLRRSAWAAVPARCYSSAGALTKEDVYARISTLLQGFDKVNDPANIKPDAHFANDLGLDSLDTVEVVMAIEEEFSIEIPDKDADQIHSIDKAVEYILSQPDAN